MKTRQATLLAPRTFEIIERDIELPPDHLLVKMQGTGMCTSELPQWSGAKSTYPEVLGHEGWGIVVDKGPQVSARFKVGDRVTGLPQHCAADYFTQPEWCSMKIRADLPEQCILGEPYYCVNNVVRAAHPTIGDCVVLIGMGPMGQWALQALASPVLQSVIVIDVDDAKLAVAKKFGATHTINPTSVDPVAAVTEITGGLLADVVIEGTGAKPGMDTAVKLLRHGQRPRLVVMSFFKAPIEIDITRLCGVSAEVIHAHPGITVNRPDHCRRTEIMINNGVFKSDHLISHRFTLEQATQGYSALENRANGFVKGIIVP